MACISERLGEVEIRRFPTMVILFFLLGVSAKHFIEEDSTTVSQNETTGSATYMILGPIYLVAKHITGQKQQMLLENKRKMNYEKAKP